ncbi:MAG TPA: DUF5069 domain-containing protein [Opitutus sp.]|nr:DUF5069 domain-containing protein [Opitutus sp.]
MPHVPGLRSPYAKVGRLVYFGRLLDKIRLHAAGQLPPDYTGNLGDTSSPNFFDGRCCRFLGVPYAAIRDRTLAGGSDEEILAWCQELGTPRSDEDCMIWNRFMSKLGWRDDRTAVVQQRIREYGLAERAAGIETMFDLIDRDEGRDPLATEPWRD